METEQLTRRRRGRFGRWSLSLMPAALLVWHDAAIGSANAEAAVTKVEVRALSTSPKPLDVTGVRSGNDIVLRGTIQFANDCLAQTGFNPIYRDLAPLQLTGARLVLLEAKRAPQGCPDIFAPVTRPLALRLPRAEEVRQIVLFDEVAGRHPAVVLPSESTSTEVGGETVQPAGALQPLAGAAIKSGLDFGFRIALPPGCSPQDVAIEIIEGRGVTAAQRAVTQVPLWVMVLTDGPGCQSDRRADSTTELVASLRSLVLRNRQLYLANPLLPPGAAEPRLFFPLTAN
jgi:hypothetical protein